MQSGGGSRWRVCYQRGLPCLVSGLSKTRYTFCLMTFAGVYQKFPCCCNVLRLSLSNCFDLQVYIHPCSSKASTALQYTSLQYSQQFTAMHLSEQCGAVEHFTVLLRSAGPLILWTFGPSRDTNHAKYQPKLLAKQNLHEFSSYQPSSFHRCRPSLGQ